MIQAMRQLALDFLYNELAGTGNEEGWYRDLRQNNMGALFPFLVEKARDSMSENYYVLYPNPNDSNVAVLEQRERKPEDEAKLPFVQSTGSQSPALGPVIKRSFQKGKGAGPSEKILNSTLAEFAKIGLEEKPWSAYFNYATMLLSRPTLKFEGKLLKGRPALHQAIHILNETKTAYVTILDAEGLLPGERQDYRAYLQEILATEKYSTQAIQPIDNQADALTGEITKIYPNSLTGGGLNLTNVDRTGVFAGLDENNAWKKFSLGAENADLLYTFSFHMRTDFIGRVAGEQALLLPHLSFDQSLRQRFVKRFKEYVERIHNLKDASATEDRLLYLFKDSPDGDVANITILWADFGQKLENVRGIVSDVLPSRLSTISQHINQLKDLNNPIFPTYRISEAEPDLAMNSLSALLKRQGGKKNKKANESAQLFEFKREMAERVYHDKTISLSRFWDEVLSTAKSYLTDIAESGNEFGLLNEGVDKKGNRFLTLAGWVKHIALYIYFLRQLEVYPRMATINYEPKSQRLKTFFAKATATAGLDSLDKIYAFLLGVLFGKLMEVQGARGVNVAANALTWLKRLSLSGADLPELYVKVREKLLVYNTEAREEVAEIIEDLGILGIQLGKPKLNKIDANYYLLLGQSLTKQLIPAKEKTA